MVKVGEIEDQSILEEGKYTFKPKKMELKQGQNFPYLNCEFVVTQGDDEGRVFFDRLILSPKSLFRLKYFLVAFGQEEAELEGIQKDEATKRLVIDDNLLAEEITGLVAGREAVADLGVEKDSVNQQTGEKYPPRNKVKSYHPAIEAGEPVSWPE